MELLEYGNIVRRRWWIPAALTLLALLAATAVALRGAAAYRTELRLSVGTQPTVDRASALYYDPIYYANLSSEYLADDLSELIRSPAFADDISQELGSTISPTVISDSTRAKKTHRLIDVTITTSTFEEGRDIGAAMVTILNDPGRTKGYLQVMEAYKGQVAIVNQPVTRRGNGTPALVAEIGLRTLVGLLLGLGLAFLVEYLDQTVRSRRDLEDLLALPVLAEIPGASGGRRRALA